MRHIVVCEQEGIFAGWPANNGIWSWEGRKILVGFTTGEFEEKSGHNIKEPYRSVLTRSKDQGESWTLIAPEGFIGSHAEERAVDAGIEFTHSGFAMRVVGTGYHGSARPAGAFYVSYDHGDRWHGPYTFGALSDSHELKGLEITSRTDYVVEGPHACLLLMSARKGAFLTDRVFCIRTSDGGRSFRFVSWVVPPSDPYRAVMPSTVRGVSGELICAIRRRETDTERCWIDAYVSEDEGHRWHWAGKVTNTGGQNGNPPALARLRDGRICCVFGERESRRMMARYSADDGRSWGGDLVLRDDFQPDRFGDADLGYPRLVQCADGRLMAFYYWATADLPRQHIAATSWFPT